MTMTDGKTLTDREIIKRWAKAMEREKHLATDLTNMQAKIDKLEAVNAELVGALDGFLNLVPVIGSAIKDAQKAIANAKD